MFSKNEKAAAPERPRTPGGKRAMPSILSEDLRITGNIVSEGDIQLEGMIDGAVRTRNLPVGDGGNIVGEVVAESVQVSGSINGRIEAKTVNLTKGARVKGDIAHGSLSIEPGADFEGHVTRLDGPGQITEPNIGLVKKAVSGGKEALAAAAEKSAGAAPRKPGAI